MPGARSAFRWTGPGHKGDFISIDKAGAGDRTYGNYAYPEAAGRLVEIRVPDEPGDYVVRYHLASSYGVIGSAPLVVQAVTASLTAPAQVPARSVFAVSWKGPNNADDFITIVAPAARTARTDPATATRNAAIRCVSKRRARPGPTSSAT